MVILKEKGSSFKAKEEPYTTEWDANMRQHHAFYQNLIDQTSYRVQKGLKGFDIFGDWTFPYRYQHRYMMLELYQKKQYLGEIRNEEIERYSKSHCGIRKDLQLTFNGSS
jgi:hypothetical protein